MEELLSASVARQPWNGVRLNDASGNDVSERDLDAVGFLPHCLARAASSRMVQNVTT